MSEQWTLLEFQEKAKEVILALKKEEAANLAKKALSELGGTDLVRLIEDGFSKGISIMGEKFGAGEVFLPELVAASDAIKEALAILEPKLKQSGIKRESMGKVLLATVEGDLHDIGKSIVASLLVARGFDVTDLGIDVPSGEIIRIAGEIEADIIGLSALLTTTLMEQQKIIDLLEEEGVREKHKVIIGGAAASKEWAEQIGADGFGADAEDGAELTIKLMRGSSL